MFERRKKIVFRINSFSSKPEPDLQTDSGQNSRLWPAPQQYIYCLHSTVEMFFSQQYQSVRKTNIFVLVITIYDRYGTLRQMANNTSWYTNF